MPSPKELREEFTKIQTEAQTAIDAAITAGTELTPEATAENDNRFARMASIKTILDNREKFAKMALESGNVTGEIEMPGKTAVEAALDNSVKTIDRREFSRAASAWAATGTMDAKFATITTATQSNILLPVEVTAPLVPSAVNTLRAAFGLYGITPMSTPTTGEITIPVFSATAGGLVSESASSETDGTPGLTESIVSKCATYQSGSVYFSNMVLAAQDFDLVSNTVPALTYQKELGLEAAIIAAMVADAGITQNVTTGSNSTLSYADLVALDEILPKKFQQQKVILLSQTAYSSACGLTFSSGPFVLTTDANGIRRFQGTPVLRCDYFAAVAASAIVGACISLAGFHLRDAG